LSPIEDVESALLRRFGLSPRDGWQAALERAVLEIGDTVNLSCDSLMERALSDVYLLKKIAGRLTVPESFFFRQVEQLQAIVDFITKRLSSTDTDATIRVWSAGCSQGEEPLSLAMLLKESLSTSYLDRVSIVGSDINASVISAAMKGIYSPWSLRGLDEKQKERYFELLENNHFMLRKEIRSMVEFQHRAIQEQISFFEIDTLDVIIFRNVAIYLTEESLRFLYEKFSTLMKEGGLLCISHSDPPIDRIDFHIAPHYGGAIYRKQSSPIGKRSRDFKSSIETSPRIPLSPRAALRQPNPISHTTPKTTLPESTDMADNLREGLSKAEEGHVAQAQQIADELLARSPDSHYGYYLTGQLALAAHDLNRAEADFRKALFKAPMDLETRFWYAVVLFEKQVHNRARAQLNALLDALSESNPKQLLVDGKTTVGELLKNAHLLLDKMK
jgi:chemotaxis protein methyltransferase CheR